MRVINFFLAHLANHLFLADRRVGVATDRAQNVPHIRAGQIGLRHAKTDLIVPADTRLRTRMPFHCAAQIPFKRANIVLLDPQPQRIHNANQFLGFGVAGTGRRPKLGAGLFKFAFFHQVTGVFNFTKHHSRPHSKNKRRTQQLFHHFAGFLLLASSASAEAISPDDFLPFDPLQAQIGQLLFYDKILSGNRNISCGTCHHHDAGSGDGLSLGIGEGGMGLGIERSVGTGDDLIRKRIPRNAPGLWNLSHKDVSVLFHDGRLEVSDIYGNGFNSPAEEWLPQGLDNLLAAQALFPLTAQFEMAGNSRENQVAGAVHDRIDNAWPILAKRVRVIPEYGAMFVVAFDHIDAPEQVTIVEVANALGAFMGSEWQSFDSAYDAYLTGGSLAADAERGRALFFGDAGCVACHSGPLFTDQEFHALGLPAFGPGRTRRWDPMPRDVGRMGESDDLADAYRFKTAPLRNVALTAPYGHNGAYPTLAGIIRHHADPLGALQAWTPDMAQLPTADHIAQIDFVIQSDSREMARQIAAISITPVALTETDIADLEAFLHALTGETAAQRPLGIPASVPSGLPLD